MTRRVSIVVNTHNRSASLSLTLESFTQLDYALFEVIVVNGPSTDGTDEVLAASAGRVKIAHCPDRNLSRSRNVGIALAAGEIVAFIDDDAYPDPAWLDRMAEGFDRDEVAGVGGPVYDHTGSSFQSVYNVATRLGDAWTRYGCNPTELVSAPGGRVFPQALGTNCAFRRDRLIEICGFDEEFDYYLDETDVACRLSDRGYLVRNLDDAFVYHKFLASHLRTPARVLRDRYSILKNKVYFALRHALPAVSFYEVCQNLLEFVEEQRADYRRNIEEGLLSEDDYREFERDIRRAFDTALERYTSGAVRTRPAAWFAERQEPFKPFPTRRQRADKLHICLFTQQYPPGEVNGIGRAVHTLATGLAAEGHLTRVFTNGANDNRIDLEEGVWVHRVAVRGQPAPRQLDVPPQLWNYSASLLAELRRVSAHRPVDIVHVPNWDSEGIAVMLDGGFLVLLGLHTPLRTVVQVDKRIARQGRLIARMLELERFGYGRAHALLASGPAIVAEIEEQYGIELDRSRLAYVAYGLPEPPREVQPHRVERAVNLLFVGRLEPRKGIDTLLECLPPLLDRFADLRVTIVGDDRIPTAHGGTYRQVFQASPAGRRFQERIEFTGRVSEDELPAYYAGCDIFVAPSRYESFGLILLEAMMFGKPVIACDAGGMSHIVEDGRNGLLVPPGDATALAGAIARLAASADLRHRLGRRSRELYEERYTVARMVDGVCRFYDRVLQRAVVREGPGTGGAAHHGAARPDRPVSADAALGG